MESDYQKALNGSFTSLLQWDALTQFWEQLCQQGTDQWYIYAVGERPPEVTASDGQFTQFIEEIDQLLRREHDERVCGIVYSNHPTAPTMVKIYDPNNLGVSCGYSENPPLPGWILSHQPPVELQPQQILPGNRKRWWQKLFS